MFGSSERPFQPKPELSSVEVEDQIDSLLDTLPTELRNQWEARNESTSSTEQLASLQILTKERASALSRRSSFIDVEQPHHVKVEHTYPLAISAFIDRLEQGEHMTLGSGLAASVIASIRNPEVCYKLMLPISEVPPGTNSISAEADLQDEIYSLGEIEGVRVPAVHTFVEHESVRAIMMERLDAVSLRDILDGKESLPEDFDITTFFTKLERFVTAMHEQGYYHRDIHEGNVMVDRNTGAPRLIDFGLAKRTFGEDNPFRGKYVQSGQSKELVLISDLGGITRLRGVMQGAVAKRGI